MTLAKSAIWPLRSRRRRIGCAPGFMHGVPRLERKCRRAIQGMTRIVRSMNRSKGPPGSKFARMRVVIHRFCLWFIIASAFVLAVLLWRDYAPRWRQLWTDVVHDRNAHLELGLGLAADLGHGRISGL